MMNYFKKASWSPYIVGASIGFLSFFLLSFVGQALGVSSAFVRIVALFESLVIPSHAASSVYFNEQVAGTPFLSFQVPLIIALIFGAHISARLSKSYRVESVPSLWKERIGASVFKRSVAAFCGGVIILFGARLAGGCTSGKAISSGLQLGLAAWVFIATLFSTGIITAHVLYWKKHVEEKS